MSAHMPTDSSPYVGPVPFEREHENLFFGRQHEIRQLMYRLIPQRIVLLNSPSGAGKTSLIQAGLIPALEREEETFRILPIMQVGQLPGPRDLEGLPAHNRYVLSALLSLEEELPEDQRLPLAKLAAMEFGAYLAERCPPDEDKPNQVLIFDQFEELLTADPTDTKAKAQFFQQVSAALQHPQRWALFSMREDYLAGLDPYLLPVPLRLETRFRLDLLAEEAALAAIQMPAATVGVTFGDNAAGTLCKELSIVRVQSLDGTSNWTAGPYAEPILLQVVCQHLWARKGPQAKEITLELVESIGNVDKALSDYYSDQVEAIATETGVSEWNIRDWFEDRLITIQGVRSQVLQEPGQSGGLDNKAIERLVRAHLVRPERRRGLTWYELAHDRLIEPVRQNNAEWQVESLEALTRSYARGVFRAAKSWHDETEAGRGDQAKKWLYRGRQLKDILAAVDLQDTDPLVVEFLNASKANQERRHKAKLRMLAVGGAVALIIIALVIIALIRASAIRAQEDLFESRTESLSAQALGSVETAPAKALLLARLATEIKPKPWSRLLSWLAPEIEPTTKAKNALYTAVASQEDPYYTPYSYAYEDHLGGLYLQGLRRVVFPAQKDTAVVSTSDGKLLSWDVGNRLQDRCPISMQAQETVYGLALSDDGSRLVTATGNQEDASVKLHGIVVWEGLSDSRPITISKTLTEGIGSVWSVTISADGDTLAAGNHDGTVTLWRNLNGETPEPETLGGRDEDEGDEHWIWTVALSPDGTTLASGSRDGEIILWDLSEEPPKRTRLGRHTNWVREVAFSPDGTRLASASDDGTIQIWDLTEKLPRSTVLKGHQGQVWTVAFSRLDGEVLASGGGPSDNSIILWHSKDGRMIERLQTDSEGQPVHASGIEDLAFSGDGRFLLSVGRGGETVLWKKCPRFSLVQPLDPANGQGSDGPNHRELDPSEVPEYVLTEHSNITVTKVIARNDNQWQVSVDSVGTLILWKKMKKGSHQTILTGGGQIGAIEFGPYDSDLLAAATNVDTEDPRIVVWDVADANILGELSLPGIGSIQSLHFADTGRALLIAVEQGQTLEWNLDLDSWRNEACNLAKRNLTYEEWEPTATEEKYLAMCAGHPVHDSVIEAATEHARSCVHEHIEEARQELQQTGLPRVDALDLVSYVIKEEAQRNIRDDRLDHGRRCLEELNRLRKEVGRPGLDKDKFVKVWELIVKGQEHSRERQFPQALEKLIEALAIDPDPEPGQKTSLVLAFHDLVKASRESDPETARKASGYVIDLVRPIQIGDSASLDPGPQDLRSFEGEPGEIISISYGATDEDSGASLVLFGPQGDIKERSTGTRDTPGARIDGYILSEAGAYLIEVTRTGGSAHDAEATLSLAEVTSEAIRIGECIPVPTEEQPVWSFGGQAGQIVSVALDTTDPNAYLTLFDEDGTELLGPTSRIDRYFLPHRGRFLIRLGTALDSAVYGLSVAEVIPWPIAVGESLKADIGTQTLWSFDGRTGQIVSISMDTVDERLNPYITLHGPQGTELDSDDDSGGGRNARIEGFVLSEAGRYVIEAEPIGVSAPYTLTLVEEAPRTVGLPAREDMAEGAAWSFYGRKNQQVSIAVEGESPQVLLTLVGPGGAILTEKAPAITSPLAESGIHTVVVHERPQRPETGWLVMRRVKADAKDLRFGEPMPGELGALDGEYWTFSGEANSATVIDVISKTAGVHLELYGTDGARLLDHYSQSAEADPTLLHSIPLAGTYTLLVRGASDDVAGSYTLALDRTENPVLRGHEGPVRSARFSPDGNRIVTTSYDGTARVWDAEIGKAPLILTGHEGSVYSADFSPDGSRIVTAGRDGTARVWDAETGKPLFNFTENEASVYSAGFSPDGSRIVTAGRDGTARVWDAETGEPLAFASELEGPVYSAGFSPDGRRIVTTSYDSTARVWDAETGEELLVLTGHEGPVYSAGFGPDGSCIVTVGEDSTARVWDAETGEAVLILTGHEGWVSSAGYSPDGSRIVTAGDDGTARVWDAETGEAVLTLTGHEGAVYSAGFSPDGSRIVTAGEDGAVRIWYLPSSAGDAQ
jgi:WD40 repeat protein